MEHFTTVHNETREGFDIELARAYETQNPRENFDDSIIDEILEGIDSGKYEWFVARVTVSKYGVILGRDYLGGCLYESVSDFIKDAYFEDMVSNAIAEARANISKLLEGCSYA